jgi:hypothetical protein
VTTLLETPSEQLDRPPLPPARGPLSAAVLALLRGEPVAAPGVDRADPYGDDLHLALHLCYELHYRGFAGVDDALEWDLHQLAVRQALEDRFLAALRADVPGGEDVEATVAGLLVEPLDGTGVSHHLAGEGERWQFREYIAQRSHYHRKEADPQAWVIPRLQGQAKAGLVTVEHDEHGGGRAAHMHSTLFAAMMTELGLDPTYGAYLALTPAPVLAEVNFQTLCGLRRTLRGASVGQFALIELTSSPGSARLVRAAQRLGLGPATEYFYAEHVEADAGHEQILRHGVLRPLLVLEPQLARDVVFGIQGSTLLGDHFG